MKIPVVNEQDEIISYKERAEARGVDIARVSALLLRNSKDEILLAQRAFTKESNPGKWTISVTGTVEEGETYDSNIVKEIEEEIGLTNIPLEKLTKFFFRSSRGGGMFCTVYTALCDKIESEFVLQKEEVHAIKWVSMQEFEAWLEKEPEVFTSSTSYFLNNILKNENQN